MKLNWEDPTNPVRNELVFQNRNKEFGAYVIRQNYSRSAFLAFVGSSIGLTLLIIFPLIKNMFADKSAKIQDVQVTEVNLMAPPPIDETAPPPPPPPPPPPVQKTIKFTPPVIVKDEEVPAEEPPPTVEEMVDNNAGVVTQEGDPNAVELPTEPVETGTGEPEIFTIVEEMPSFPGGEAALRDFIQANIKFPPRAREAGISGTVYVNFIVGKDGKVSEVKVLRGLGGGTDEEAMRVVKSMPPWRPGKQRGEPVIVSFNLPIKFSLK